MKVLPAIVFCGFFSYQPSCATRYPLPAAVPANLLNGQADEVWAAFSMENKRAVLAALVTVTIMPSGSGKAFDPDSVLITWKS